MSEAWGALRLLASLWGARCHLGNGVVLKVRDEQYAALQDQAKLRFEDRVVRHLRTHLAEPTQNYTDDELRERIRVSQPRAAQYGLISERHIVSFVDATFLIGEQFDSDPKHSDVRDVLTSKDLDGNTKAGFLVGIAYGRRYRGAVQG